MAAWVGSPTWNGGLVCFYFRELILLSHWSHAVVNTGKNPIFEASLSHVTNGSIFSSAPLKVL